MTLDPRVKISNGFPEIVPLILKTLKQECEIKIT